MATRYIRYTELIADAINSTRRGVLDVQRPTGTERARTMETAIQAAEDSEFAKQLAEQLQVELEAAQLELTQALADAALALEEAGLARTEAGQAVAAAADAATQATDAYNAAVDALDKATSADGRLTVADAAPVAGDGAGKPIGALWIMRDAGIEQMWEWTSLGWVLRPLDETIIPKIAIGTGTYGDLAGDRLVARSIVAGKIEALSLTANELAANAVTAVKIAANAVTAEKILAGSVTTGKLDALAVTAEKLAVGSVIAEKIATGAIVAGKIAADAIDGMVITGATIRTAPAGQRMQFDIDGLVAYDASNNITAVISSAGGGMTVKDVNNSSVGLTPRFGIGGAVNNDVDREGNWAIDTNGWRASRYGEYLMGEFLTGAVRGVPTASRIISSVPFSLEAPGDMILRPPAGGAGGEKLTVEHENFQATYALVTTLKAFFTVHAEDGLIIGNNSASKAPMITETARGLLIDARNDPSTFNDVEIKAGPAGQVTLTAGTAKRIKALSPLDAPSLAVTGAATAATVAASTSVASPSFKNPAGGRSAAYATDTGQVLSSAGAYTTVTFPVGKFTVPPRMQAMVLETTGGQVSIPWVPLADVKAASFKITAFTLGGLSINAVHHYTATQATATSADG